MTVDTLQPAPAPTWIGQATAVEQARAVAEVAAAVQVAKMFPRDIISARSEMQRACSRFAMADRAFYNFRRGGQSVNGPTVYLARELGRIFGNLQWGIQELRRDETGGLSEMQAFAWDVEHNSRQSTTFVVPHARDVTIDGENVVKPLATLRDVYENNANQGARRQREMILGLLPQWFVDEAIDLCRAALRKGEGDKTLEQRVASAVQGFADVFRVDRARLERHVGAPVTAWSEQDVADIGVVFRSLQRGELTVAEAFPTASVTAADLGAPAAPAAAPAERPAAAPTEDAPTASAAPLPPKTWRAIQARFNELGVVGDGQTAKRRDVMCRLLGRQVAKPDDLTAADGDVILANLGPRVVAEVLGVNSGEQEAASAEEQPADDAPEREQPADDGGMPAGYDPTTDDDWPAAEQSATDWTEEQQP